MKNVRKAGLGIILMTLLLMLAACGNENSSAQADSEKTKITIATGGYPKPFSYVNDNNELDGYDIQVVKKIFEGLPQYDVTLETTEFSSVFAGLDSDRYQIGANNFAKNEKRAEKYLFSDPIFKNQYVIAVAEDRDDIQSFADLEGKSTEVSSGVNYTVALEHYNETIATTPVVLKYTESEMVTILQNVDSGVVDFNLIDNAMLQLYIKEYGLKLKAIPLSEEDSERIGAPYSYLLLSKGGDSEQLLKDVNGRIKELLTDGSISEISEKYLLGDFAPEVQ